MSQDRILIVEDDSDSAQVLSAYLQRDGFLTCHVTDGRQAIEQHARWRPDLILLDVMLPSLSGNEVLASIRQHATTPIIMLTAVSHEVNRINSLLFGADDYVVKPYNPGEVVARVFAVLRRWQATRSSPNRVWRYDKLTVDLDAALASVETNGRNQSVPLTRTEFNLLSVMIAQPLRMYSRAELLSHCLPHSDATERVVDAHLYNLRRKLNKVGVINIILTVRGQGYRFCDPK